MQNVVIERYQPEVPGFAGNIQDDERSWIVYLDAVGKPALYWPKRDDQGAVIGKPIKLR